MSPRSTRRRGHPAPRGHRSARRRRRGDERDRGGAAGAAATALLRRRSAPVGGDGLGLWGAKRGFCDSPQSGSAVRSHCRRIELRAPRTKNLIGSKTQHHKLIACRTHHNRCPCERPRCCFIPARSTHAADVQSNLHTRARCRAVCRAPAASPATIAAPYEQAQDDLIEWATPRPDR